MVTTARWVAVLLIAGFGWLLTLMAATSTSGAPSQIPLPAPQHDIDPLAGIGLTRDRLLTSVTPGAATNREDVTVAVGPTGDPQRVVDVQRLALTGTGGYVIRERGPAREATALDGTVPPVLELGTVVWQGFSPGRRLLAARLILDAGLEAQRLPLTVRLQFRDAAGQVRSLRPGLVAPVAGTVQLTLLNRTASVMVEPVGTGAPRPLATALDALRHAAQHPTVGPPPTAGDGLPVTLPGRLAGRTAATAIAPLRIAGTANGRQISGLLDGQASISLPVRAGQRVALRLTVQPYLDPRLIVPPKPANSWKQWARGHPSASARRSATMTLIAAAASAARAGEYSPYLQADIPGPDRSTFTYVSEQLPPPPRVIRTLHPHAGAIAAACVAALAIIANLALLRRRL